MSSRRNVSAVHVATAVKNAVDSIKSPIGYGADVRDMHNAHLSAVRLSWNVSIIRICAGLQQRVHRVHAIAFHRRAQGDASASLRPSCCRYRMDIGPQLVQSPDYLGASVLGYEKPFISRARTHSALLGHGADPNSLDSDGRTSLHLAGFTAERPRTCTS